MDIMMPDYKMSKEKALLQLDKLLKNQITLDELVKLLTDEKSETYQAILYARDVLARITTLRGSIYQTPEQIAILPDRYSEDKLIDDCIKYIKHLKPFRFKTNYNDEIGVNKSIELDILVPRGFTVWV